jgi:hypothetical protein
MPVRLALAALAGVALIVRVGKQREHRPQGRLLRPRQPFLGIRSPHPA